MPIAMQCNRRSLRLPRPHLRPELRIGILHLKFRVAVIGNHRKHRPNAKLIDQRLKPLPPAPRHRGTQIVKSQQILRRPHRHHAASIRMRSTLRDQYHRNPNVLTVHSDVASAIPATPYRRISTRFSTTSSPRFSSPQ